MDGGGVRERSWNSGLFYILPVTGRDAPTQREVVRKQTYIIYKRILCTLITLQSEQ